MAVSFITTIGTTDYGFDWVNKVIEVEAAVTDVSAADLKSAIHDAQDGTEGMSFDQIAAFGNPVVLTGSSSTFLNVILLSTWKILSLSVSGTFTVGDGNVVSLADGIDIFAPNASVTYVNNTSAAGVLVESGVSGLTASEALMLTEVYTRLDLETANPNTYADDGSSIANTDFTLTKSDNGDGTFDVDRT